MKLLVSREKSIIFGLICLGCVTISFNVAAITAVIPLMSQDLQLPNLVVSKIIPFYMIPYGLGALLYAPLTKIFSYRRIISVSMALFSLTCFVCARVDDIQHLLWARMLMGMAGASAIPLGLIIIGEFFEKATRGRLVGIFFGCSFFASLAGIALGGLADWRWLFRVPAGLSLILAVLCYILPLPLFRQVHGVHVNYLSIMSKVKVRNIFIFISVISALYHAVHKWFGIFLSQIYGLDKFAISALFILAAIAGFGGQIGGGILSDAKGRRCSTYWGIVGLAASILILSLQYSFFFSSVAIILVSFFWTIGHNGISTVLTDFTDSDRPVLASLNSAVRFLAGGLGFYISGLFIENNFGQVFFIISLLMIILSLTVKKVIDDI